MGLGYALMYEIDFSSYMWLLTFDGEMFKEENKERSNLSCYIF
jgi:hypothetical protein